MIEDILQKIRQQSCGWKILPLDSPLNVPLDNVHGVFPPFFSKYAPPDPGNAIAHCRSNLALYELVQQGLSCVYVAGT